MIESLFVSTHGCIHSAAQKEMFRRGLAQSFEFCFDGVERNSIVAIGMIGCKQNKHHFLRGYNAMLERISPSQIICFGAPFEEMEGNIISVDYMESRKVVR